MIESIIKSNSAELTQNTKKGAPVVLSTRVRLARNLADTPFPERATPAQRSDIMSRCVDQICELKHMKNGAFFEVSELSELEKQVLVERHLISRELCESEQGSGVFINKEQTCSVMINEEDHLRIQFLKTGFNLNSIWKQIDHFDSDLEKTLDVAFSPEFGFLTACPTNLGTGLRASVMMHLPGLVIAEHMERVIRAVNQLGITVRGLFGEGSDATGHVFQISNQQTLGESEGEIMNRLGNVLKTIIDHELNARFKYLESNRAQMLDKIGRAFGVLQNVHVISSNEAMNLLSLMRLAVDFKMLPESNRSDVDRLFIECQPGHIQYAANVDIDPEARDLARADKLRKEFSNLPPLSFDKVGEND
ncbi:MAG: protein arginine kinase [Opitutales bacterium]|jgi:protein arginine kinase|nr:protein arginine kinase [Opitutales bacterium]MDP4645180.1 protein arginine kinase [Opitutales bacterium]MDP4778467.1 protein arginine kinase [Opitutales bacterium]MDP4884503.1 protein arginine kinase [Opitutales bacterium]MDP5080729.1 protein arginine kinase [Opitutales bacterium]